MKKRGILALMFVFMFTAVVSGLAAEEKREKTKEELEKERQEKIAKAVAFAENGTQQQIEAANTANKASQIMAGTAQAENAVKAARQYRTF